MLLILLHRSECWILKREQENELNISERKVFRRCWTVGVGVEWRMNHGDGTISGHGICRIRYNHELYKVTNNSNSAQVI